MKELVCVLHSAYLNILNMAILEDHSMESHRYKMMQRHCNLCMYPDGIKIGIDYLILMCFSVELSEGSKYDRPGGSLDGILLGSCSSPRWDNLPSGNQWYPLLGLNLGYMYWGQKKLF